MASKIGKGEWIGVYAFFGIIDAIQWGADLFIGPGEAANEIADPIIGICMAGYFQLRGVSLIDKPMRLAAIIGGDIAEQLSVSVAPAWIMDVWYIHRTVKQEEAEIAAQQEQEAMLQGNVRQPFYKDGIGKPRNESNKSDGPSNIGGIRPPKGGDNVIRDIDFRPRGGEDALEEAA